MSQRVSECVCVFFLRLQEVLSVSFYDRVSFLNTRRRSGLRICMSQTYLCELKCMSVAYFLRMKPKVRNFTNTLQCNGYINENIDI
jgi:hypothetical protein